MRSARRATSVAAEATNVSSAQTSFHRTAAGPACDGELITLLLERAFNGHSGIATEIPILFAAASEIRKQETEPSCGHRQQWQDWELRGAVRIAQLMDSELALVLRDC